MVEECPVDIDPPCATSLVPNSADVLVLEHPHRRQDPHRQLGPVLHRGRADGPGQPRALRERRTGRDRPTQLVSDLHESRRRHSNASRHTSSTCSWSTARTTTTTGSSTTAGTGSTTTRWTHRHHLTSPRLNEWTETEKWSGVALAGSLSRSMRPSRACSGAAHPPTQGILNLSYTITRRPMVSSGSREVALPSNVVIDLTTWATTHERSRFPLPPSGNGRRHVAGGQPELGQRRHHGEPGRDRGAVHGLLVAVVVRAQRRVPPLLAGRAERRRGARRRGRTPTGPAAPRRARTREFRHRGRAQGGVQPGHGLLPDRADPREHAAAVRQSRTRPTGAYNLNLPFIEAQQGVTGGNQ